VAQAPIVTRAFHAVVLKQRRVANRKVFVTVQQLGSRLYRIASKGPL
jgi:hypothetical protein